MYERFGGCMFFDDKKRPNFITTDADWPKGAVSSTAVMGPTTKPALETNSLPYDFFTDLSVFTVPPLGWRSTAQGRVLVHFRRNNRSYHRAISAGVLIQTVSPVTKYLYDTGNISSEYYSRNATLVSMVMNPEYTPFKEGIEALRSGKVISFCVSPTIAVIPDAEEKQAIYFNTNKVGEINPDDSIKCYSPVVQLMVEDLFK